MTCIPSVSVRSCTCRRLLSNILLSWLGSRMSFAYSGVLQNVYTPVHSTILSSLIEKFGLHFYISAVQRIQFQSRVQDVSDLLYRGKRRSFLLVTKNTFVHIEEPLMGPSSRLRSRSLFAGRGQQTCVGGVAAPPSRSINGDSSFL